MIRFERTATKKGDFLSSPEIRFWKTTESAEDIRENSNFPCPAFGAASQTAPSVVNLATTHIHPEEIKKCQISCTNISRECDTFCW